MTRTFEQIAYDAAYATGTLKVDVLNSNKRGYDVSLAKALVCYLARMELQLSFVELADMVGLPTKNDVLKGFNRISVSVAKRNPEIMKLVELAK
jgi:chromosomal replication initiation ATPase DnaA